jgi:hypothetical protein
MRTAPDVRAAVMRAAVREAAAVAPAPPQQPNDERDDG